MKCYYEDETSAAVVTVSLADALLKVCEYHCIDAFSAANMIQLSSPARTVTVMTGTVWAEDDVPVLDIDRVIEDWFTSRPSWFAPSIRTERSQPWSCVVLATMPSSQSTTASASGTRMRPRVLPRRRLSTSSCVV
jgi:hypothetical protein